MRRSLALSIRVGALPALLALHACAGAPQSALAAGEGSISLDACSRNIQSAARDVWFMCSLASASLAHEEAGREAIGNADCIASPERCEAPDTELVVRVLFSPPAFGRGPPRASSIEVSGFGRKQAHADMRELVGPQDWYTRQQMGAHFQRPPMRAGAGGGFDLSKRASLEVMQLANALRAKPEQHTWTMCSIDEPEEDNDLVIMMGDAAGIFIQLFFGGEEHAYLRNSMYLGHAGDIAALVFGDPRNTDACMPDKRL